MQLNLNRNSVLRGTKLTLIIYSCEKFGKLRHVILYVSFSWFILILGYFYESLNVNLV